MPEKQFGAGDYAGVVSEEQASQGGEGSREVNKSLVA